MENKIISFETAVLAKEKGFLIFEDFWYDRFKNLSWVRHPGDEGLEDYIVLEPNKWDLENLKSYQEGYYFAPTQSLLQKWLREVHDIHINLTHSYTKGKLDLGFYYHIESAKYNFMGGYTYDDN